MRAGAGRLSRRGVAAMVLGLACLAWGGAEPAAGAGLPPVREAALNQWIAPPPTGVKVVREDFAEGSFLRNVVEWSEASLTGKRDEVYLCALYRIKAGPGLYTAVFKAPALQFHRVQALWVDGDPADATYQGKKRGRFIHSNPSYSPKKYGCDEYGYRTNFKVGPESQGSYLYMIALTSRPGTPFSVMLQSPGLPDAEVNSAAKPPPWCPQAKGYTWGNAFTRYPLVLRADPGTPDKAESGCENGCAGKVGVAGPRTGRVRLAQMNQGECPPGYQMRQTGPHGWGCYACQEGESLVIASSHEESKNLACLSCPEGSDLVVVQREEGRDSSGQTWIQNKYVCLSCEQGYELVYPLERKGRRADGTGFSSREAACWRCPPGLQRKEKIQTTRLPDGTIQVQRTYYCQ